MILLIDDLFLLIIPFPDNFIIWKTAVIFQQNVDHKIASLLHQRELFLLSAFHKSVYVIEAILSLDFDIKEPWDFQFMGLDELIDQIQNRVQLDGWGIQRKVLSGGDAMVGDINFDCIPIHMQIL